MSILWKRIIAEITSYGWRPTYMIAKDLNQTTFSIYKELKKMEKRDYVIGNKEGRNLVWTLSSLQY